MSDWNRCCMPKVVVGSKYQNLISHTASSIVIGCPASINFLLIHSAAFLAKLAGKNGFTSAFTVTKYGFIPIMPQKSDTILY